MKNGALLSAAQRSAAKWAASAHNSQFCILRISRTPFFLCSSILQAIMKSTLPLLVLLLFHALAAAVVVAASAADDQQQRQQLPDEDVINIHNTIESPASTDQTTADVEARASLRRGLKKQKRLRDNIFDTETDSAIASNSASPSESSSPNPCKKYDPSSDERKLCNLLRSYFTKDEETEESEESEESDSSDDKSGICEKIDEIYDSVIVVDVIETAGLSLDDVFSFPKGDLRACILAAYEMLPSSAPSDVPSLAPSSSPSSIPTQLPSQMPSKSFSQCDVLKALYFATQGDNWTRRSSWPRSNSSPLTWESCCKSSTWQGVGCDSQGNVESIFLPANNLVGNIPSELWELPFLRSLQLFGNEISGAIPPEIGYLSNLQRLELHFTKISGNIPSEISTLSSLEILKLYQTQISGNIPSEIGNLTNLQDLTLGNTQISGNIPSEIGNLSNLQDLDLRNTQISGNIPSEIGNLSNLQDLILHSTKISGNIPDEVCGLFSSSGKLKILLVSFNPIKFIYRSQTNSIAECKSTTI